jgi:hypothetical protein
MLKEQMKLHKEKKPRHPYQRWIEQDTESTIAYVSVIHVVEIKRMLIFKNNITW